MASRALRITLGSTSAIKREAVEAAFPGCLVQQHNVPSGVPEQPVGRAQTEQGARNRCSGALKAAVGPVDLAIGIENGMWREASGEGFVDGAAVVVHRIGSDEPILGWSDVLPIPADHPPGDAGMWSALKGQELSCTLVGTDTVITDDSFFCQCRSPFSSYGRHAVACAISY